MNMAAFVPAAEDPAIDRSLFAELYRFCREGLLKELTYALSYEKNIMKYFEVKNLKGQTLLHEAVEADQPDIVQKLLLLGVAPDMKAKAGVTPLHLAVSKCHVDCVRALLENGADITVKDEIGHDAMMKAEVRGKKREAIQNLLRSKGKVHSYVTVYLYDICRYVCMWVGRACPCK